MRAQKRSQPDTIMIVPKSAFKEPFSQCLKVGKAQSIFLWLVRRKRALKPPTTFLRPMSSKQLETPFLHRFNHHAINFTFNYGKPNHERELSKRKKVLILVT